MSDENLNNNTTSNEETAALFVSAQKRKAAQEEAAKRAAAEQAQREAAEAEVRRMEAEVEERRRKAEEEKKALEEAKQNMDTRTEVSTASVLMQGVSSKIPDSIRKKLPLILGIAGAAIAALVVVIVIIATGGKKIDYEKLACNGEYVVEHDDFSLKFAYPDSIYEEITVNQEESEDNVVVYDFSSKNKKAPKMQLRLGYMDMSVAELQYHPGDVAELFEQAAESFYGNGVEADEKIDPTAGDGCKYLENFSGTMKEEKEETTVAGTYWLERTENDAVVMIILLVGEEKAKDAENVTAMRDLVISKNTREVLSSPGLNPPETLDWDAAIALDDILMQLPVPKDRFKFLKTLDDKSNVYCDDNGAIILTNSTLYYPGGDEAPELTDDVYDTMMEYFSVISKEGLGEALPLQNRSFVSEELSPYAKWEYKGEFSVEYEGMKYHETDFMFLCTVDNDIWLGLVCTYVPEKNKEDYANIFNRSFETLDDL